MQRSIPRRIVLVVGSLVLALIGFNGCARQLEDQSVTLGVITKAVDELDSSVHQRIVNAKDDLFARLSGRLMQEMQAAGPASAIKVCREEAPQIAAAVSQENGLKIARTSLKLRNPKNAPPTWVNSVIQKQPEEPQFFELADGKTGALLPIKLQNTCLICHGPKENMLDEVKMALAQLYPDDQATGYNEGDLRGWFWIEAPLNASPEIGDAQDAVDGI